jgi:hypothetical protein
MTKINRIADCIAKAGMAPDKDIIHMIQCIVLEPTNEPLVNEKPLVNETPKVSSTGAVRSKLLAEELRFDLLDSNDSAMRRLAAVFALGFKKYGADNWKKGFPNSEYYAHAREHMLNYASTPKDCIREEDDLAHACWNLMAMMWNEENLPEMCDFPVKVNMNIGIHNR